MFYHVILSYLKIKFQIIFLSNYDLTTMQDQSIKYLACEIFRMVVSSNVHRLAYVPAIFFVSVHFITQHHCLFIIQVAAIRRVQGTYTGILPRG